MRIILALIAGCALGLAACSVAPGSSVAPSTSPAPSPSVALARAPSAAPTPSGVDIETPTPTIVEIAPTAEELLSGVRRDLRGTCTPLSDDLPPAALAAIECKPRSDVVRRVTLYLFGGQQDLLDAYRTRLAANGVTPYTNGGRCEADTASEGGYVPGDGHPGITVVERGGCYLDGSGKAHFAATLPPFVLIEVDGRVGDMPAVERWAWRGNQDQPGSPTIWPGNDQ
jgi:hypothetical protein